MLTLEDLWPPFGLRVICGALELSAMRDEDLPGLVGAAAAGIHGDELRPFPTSWAGRDPVVMGRDLASRYWKYRAGLSPDDWTLPLVVRLDGEPVGVQGAEAVRYPILRTPDTFSWLTQPVQGRGIGTLMRQMICAFLFDELDAAAITSGAYADNPRSSAVSHKLGYRHNGTKLELRDDLAAEHHRYILSRADFRRADQPVIVHGAAQVRAMLGIARPDECR